MIGDATRLSRVERLGFLSLLSVPAGRRMDNRAADRHGHPGKKGYRFFQEDEDDFNLEVSAQHMCYECICAVLALHSIAGGLMRNKGQTWAQDILMAMCYEDSGSSWVPAKPWDHGTPSKRVADATTLPRAARKHLERLRCRADGGEADGTIP